MVSPDLTNKQKLQKPHWWICPHQKNRRPLCSAVWLTSEEVWPKMTTVAQSGAAAAAAAAVLLMETSSPEASTPCGVAWASDAHALTTWEGGREGRVGGWLHGTSRGGSCVKSIDHREGRLAPALHVLTLRARVRGGRERGSAAQGSGGSVVGVRELHCSLSESRSPYALAWFLMKTTIRTGIWTGLWHSSSTRGLYWLQSDWCTETSVMQRPLLAFIYMRNWRLLKWKKHHLCNVFIKKVIILFFFSLKVHHPGTESQRI